MEKKSLMIVCACIYMNMFIFLNHNCINYTCTFDRCICLPVQLIKCVVILKHNIKYYERAYSASRVKGFIWDIVITSILFVSGKAVQNFCSVMPSFPIVSSYNIQCLFIFILCYFSRVIKPTINIWICLLYCYCNYVGEQTHTLSDITIKV